MTKIGWILSGSKNVAGARIQGWNMHEEFLKRGISSEIISFNHYNYDLKFSREEIDKILEKKYNLVVLQKIQTGENFNYLIEQARKKGTKIILIGIDSINVDFAVKCDSVIVVSRYLKNLIPKKEQNKTFLVFDSYEHSKEQYKKHNDKKKLKLVFVSNNVLSKFPQIELLPKDVSLTIVGPPEERVKKFMPDKKMFTETPYKFKYIVWDLEKVHKEILKCDVGVIPYRDKDLEKDFVKRKSNNRLVLFMSLGMPAIVSPTPEYKKLIKHGKRGFIAKNPDEWNKFIELLRDNPKMRKKIGDEARKSIKEKFSLESQANLYLKIFSKTLGKKSILT